MKIPAVHPAFSRVRRGRADDRSRPLIAASGLFDEEWYLARYHDVADAKGDPLDHYLRFGSKEGRQPGPLFDQNFYLASNPDVAGRINPLRHYVEVGFGEGRRARTMGERAPGRGDGPIVPLELAASLPAGVRVAVHVHAFYLDVFAELLPLVRLIPGEFTLLVTTPSAEHAAEITGMLKASGFHQASNVKVCRNRGRNFAPMLVEFREELLASDVFLHLHTKKSSYTGSEQKDWRDHLYHSLLPNRFAVGGLVNAFCERREIGAIYPPPYRNMPYWGHHWLSNGHLVRPFFEAIGVEIEAMPHYLDFSIGSMFWARTAALERLLGRRWTYEDFPEEAGQNDGTVAHVIERSIGLLVRERGYEITEFDATSGGMTLNWSGRNIGQYFHKREQQFEFLIDDSSVVSFDIFDTLFARMALSESSLLRFIGYSLSGSEKGAEEFHRLRRQAESDARQGKETDGDVTIDGIYGNFPKGGFLGRSPDALKAIERAVSARTVWARAPVVNFARYAARMGKRVAAVSDTHFTRSDIAALFEQTGISNVFEDVFLSSEQGLRKDRGDMWDMLRDRYAPASDNVHMGSDEHSDAQLPGDRKFKTFHIMRPAVLLEVLGIDAWPSRNWKADLVRGPVACRLGENPFLENGSIRLATGEDVGFTIFGPVIFGFVTWLARQQELRQREVVFFSSANGTVVRDAYDWVRKRLNDASLPESRILPLSEGSAVMCALCRDVNFIDTVLRSDFKGSLRAFLKAKLGIDRSASAGVDDIEIELPRHGALVRAAVRNIWRQHSPSLRDRNETLRSEHRRLGFGVAGRDTLVGSGHDGFVQRSLQFANETGIRGLYMATDRDLNASRREWGGTVDGYYYEHGIDADADNTFLKHTGLLDRFLAPQNDSRASSDERESSASWRSTDTRLSIGQNREFDRMRAGCMAYFERLYDAFGVPIFDIRCDASAFAIGLSALSSGKLKLPDGAANVLGVPQRLYAG